MEEIKAVSLFSGAGGMALGLDQIDGVRVKAMVEKNSACCKTLNENFGDRTIIEEDIKDVSSSDIFERSNISPSEVGLVSGGPPCQSFSRSYEGRRSGLKNEEKGGLTLEFVRMVDELRPEGFIFENVSGLASSNNGEDLERLLSDLSSVASGRYKVNYSILNAAEYGAPQKRKRLFILGLKGPEKPGFPEPTHASKPEEGSGREPYRTAGDVIGELDDGVDREGAKEVGGKWGHLLDGIPPGENYQYYTERRKREYGHAHDAHFEWRSRFWTFLLKLDPDEPSTTIQANPGPYTGPFHWRNRPLTVLERKRLMTIPDNFSIKGSEREIIAQIGNAVPPKLAERVGKTIVEQMLSLGLVKAPASRMLQHFKRFSRNIPFYARSAIQKAGEIKGVFG